MELTFALIKPETVKEKLTGKIVELIELNGFAIKGLRKELLTNEQVHTFYAVHSHRPWFGEMVAMMTAGPVVLMALEKENAVNDWRLLMGATNPAESAVGTLRKMFGKNMGSNALHGSDSQQTAQEEVVFFFPKLK